jgi:hypothetical protein
MVSEIGNLAEMEDVSGEKSNWRTNLETKYENSILSFLN